MPAVSLYVSSALGMGNFASGSAVGIAFLSTIFSRGWAGKVADEDGAKSGTLRGLLLYTLASLLCLVSTLLVGQDSTAAYVVLLIGRLLLGLGESLALIGLLAWCMSTLGPNRVGLVLSLFGTGIYGAFALGGPLGLWLIGSCGFTGLFMICLSLPLVSAMMLWKTPASQTANAGARLPFARVLGLIWRPGVVVGLQGIGFAALGAFFPLYFLAKGWQGAGFGLTCFGLGFVVVRLFCGNLPDRCGGALVALVSLTVEALGQLLLWLAPEPVHAMAGALLTGMGCSMIFPAMGAEAVKRVPLHLRGTAIFGVAVFQDLAYGTTGPLAGLVADRFGYPPIFLIGAVAAGISAFLVLGFRSNKAAPQDST